jgi:RND family efflux transporter MFP subunit
VKLLRNFPVQKIVSVAVVAVVLVLVLGVSVVLAMKWVTISWTTKVPMGEVDRRIRKVPSDAPRDKVYETVKAYEEEALGTLKAATRTEIAARVLAPIQRVMVRAGQRVNQGDDLIILDRRALETQRSKVAASLKSAEASLDKAKRDFARATQLIKTKNISREQYDEQRARIEVAEANLTYAKQALAEADVQLSYSVIKAPKSGIIVDRLAEEGDMAQPGVPLLILYDPTSLRLEVPVMENLALKLKPGQRLKVRIDALRKGDEPPPTVEATVDEIVPQAEAASRSFLVKVAIPKLPGVFEGMFGRLIIPAGMRRHLCLPTAAIERIGQLEMVDVIRPDGTLERRFVKTGRRGMEGRVEVLSGVEAGEEVLLKPAAKESQLD